jgi:flagellar biosynthetic protein FliR
MGLSAANINWLAMLAVLARIGAALAVTPPFAHVAIPRRVRALLAIGLSLGLVPGLSVGATSANSLGGIALIIGGEVLIGLAMGLAIGMVFAAASWAGDLVSHQLGLSLAEAYDPASGSVSGSEGSPLAQAYWMLAVVVFFAANGHHALLCGLRGSFDIVPLGGAANGAAVVTMLVTLLHAATTLALQLAAPAFVATLAADVVLGLAGKTIPQMSGLTVGLPLRSMTGLIIVIAGIALSIAVLQGATLNFMNLVQTLIRP